MQILILIRLLVRAFSTAGALKERHSKELEEFDKKHNISSPNSKLTSNAIVWIKIILISLLMGDFSFLGDIRINKYMSITALIFIGIFVFLYIAIIMTPCEKESQRRNAYKKEYDRFSLDCAKRTRNRREFREKSKYLDDFGF